GSLLLANDGICLLPNMITVKKEYKERLRRVMETRMEAVEIPKKYTEYAQHLTVPMKSSVWACYEAHDFAPKVNATESWDAITQVDFTQNLGATTQALMNRFDLVVSVNDCNNSKNVSHTSELALMRAMDDYDEKQHIFIPEEEINEFLQFVLQRPVSFGESPQKLIQSFYLAGRRARSLQGDFPLSSLQTM
ncbi:hypothetical protein QZH41_015831, partial [Actinostola sp. cb2023]